MQYKPHNAMTLSSFSIQHTLSFLIKTGAQCLKRFPVTIGFVWVLSAYLFIRVYNPPLIKEWEWNVTCSYYLLTGSLLSLTLHLWGEEQKNKPMVWSAFFIGLFLLLADSIYLHYQALTQELVLSRGALIFSMLLSAFILPFIKEKEDVAAWNFSASAIQAFSLALCTGVIMTGGIILLLISLDKLFNIEISTNYFIYVSILCNVILSPMLFLGLLPEKEKKHDNRFYHSHSSDNILRWLFLPLLMSYMAVLYIYEARIITLWELPDGWVSWLVTALSVGCILLLSLLYPIRMRGNRRFDILLFRWLPLLVLPLLILMTVGIIRRFNDYGLTVNRLYLFTFNLWLYGVFIGLWINRGRRMIGIPISFAIVFMLTSVSPINYTSITYKVLLSQVTNELKQNGATQLPLTKEEYEAWLNKQPQERQMRVNEKLKYLSLLSINGELDAEIVEAGTPFYSYAYNMDAINDEVEDIEFMLDTPVLTVPKGFRNFRQIQNLDIPSDGKLTPDRLLTIPIPDTGDTCYIKATCLLDAAKEDKATKAIALPSASGEYVFIITSYRKYSVSSPLHIDGYLFFNKNIQKQ